MMIKNKVHIKKAATDRFPYFSVELYSLELKGKNFKLGLYVIQSKKSV